MPTGTRRALAVTGLGVAIAATVLVADHSWADFHWARTANPFTLKTGDNVDGNWDVYLDQAIADWNASSVLDLQKVTGSANPKNCRPTAGRIEVCNAKYGRNGWLGIAQVWASGNHITQATTRVNDTYFNMPDYNKPEWRRLVMCQELAHDFGLDHQDENFDNPNLGSCMDYTGDPLGPPSNVGPNQHDFDQIEAIYAHLDGTTTVGQAVNRGAAGAAQLDRGQFGRLIRSTNGGRTELYELDFGGGQRVFTHVIWAE